MRKVKAQKWQVYDLSSKSLVIALGPFDSKSEAVDAAERKTISSPELIGQLVPIEVPA